ncbi:hypothetical protein NVP1121O_164 [Vibrio phage 1.121.O._10N.286.46.C4]|nr:hypothetical protein NVP1121O_164 [Vibrio phage 1.121.O._10N.286.46.C4]
MLNENNIVIDKPLCIPTDSLTEEDIQTLLDRFVSVGVIPYEGTALTSIYKFQTYYTGVDFKYVGVEYDKADSEFYTYFADLPETFDANVFFGEVPVLDPNTWEAFFHKPDTEGAEVESDESVVGFTEPQTLSSTEITESNVQFHEVFKKCESPVFAVALMMDGKTVYSHPSYDETSYFIKDGGFYDNTGSSVFVGGTYYYVVKEPIPAKDLFIEEMTERYGENKIVYTSMFEAGFVIPKKEG